MWVLYVIFAAITAGDLAWWRWADGKARRLTRGRRLLRGFVAVFAAAQLAYMAYFLLDQRAARRSHPWLPVPALATSFIWSLLGLPLVLLGNGVAGGARRVAKLAGRKPSPADGPAVTRRQALATTATVLVPPLLTGVAAARGTQQLGTFRVRDLHLSIPSLPPNLDGLTIAHVSDTHVGRWTRPGQLERVVEVTNRMKADLVLFTGDLIDLSIDDLPRGIDAMKKLDPRHGFTLVEGNHDLIEDPDAFDERVRAAGLQLLVDEAATVTVRGERVQLLGMRWGAATGDRRKASAADFRHSVADVLVPLRDPAAFPILLAHHPHAFDPAAAAGLPLTLSGHTHGGQLNLTDRVGFGPLLYRYWSGPYRRGDSHAVVSNGTGNWFPLRARAPAEIIRLTLHAGR